MRAKEYAKALFEILESAKSAKEQEQVLDNFKQFLQKKEKLKILRKVFFELLRIYEKENKRAPQIILASEEFEKTSKEVAKSYGIENPNIKVNPNLIGGFIIKGRNFIFDNSYKHHLLELYKRIVNS